MTTGALLDCELKNWRADCAKLHDHYTDVLRKAGTILYGRTTYQLMEAFWPTIVEKPTGDKHMDDFANAIQNVSKVLFSKHRHLKLPAMWCFIMPEVMSNSWWNSQQQSISSSLIVCCILITMSIRLFKKWWGQLSWQERPSVTPEHRPSIG